MGASFAFFPGDKPNRYRYLQELCGKHTIKISVANQINKAWNFLLF